MLPVQVQYWDYVEQKRHNLASEAANFMQAIAAQRQAGAAESQAKTADYNAYTNRLNYDVNKQNAMTNLKNAETNAFNAQTNARNAAVNERNAAVNERTAAVKEREVAIEEKKFPYYVMDTQSSRMIAEAQRSNANTNAYNARVNESIGKYNAVTNRTLGEYNAVTNRTQGEAALNIQKYNAQVNARLTNAQAKGQVISNVFAPYEKSAGLINTTSQTTYNYARALESTINGITKIPISVIDSVSKLANKF